jgi:hypothetical protein
VAESFDARRTAPIAEAGSLSPVGSADKFALDRAWQGTPISRELAMSVLHATEIPLKRRWEPDVFALALARIIGDIFARGGRQATAKEIRTVARAYRKFQDALDHLKGTTMPPPVIPRNESGWTDFDNWLAAIDTFGKREAGHPRRDDRAVCRLLSLFAAAFQRKRGQQGNGPRCQFLRAVRQACGALPEVKILLNIPSEAALAKQLPLLEEQSKSGEWAYVIKQLRNAQAMLTRTRKPQFS